MFRYLCIWWNSADLASSMAGHRISDSMRVKPGWRMTLDRPDARLFVFERNHRPNRVYPLYRGQGAIVGRLFRREAHDAAQVAGDFELTEDDSLRILSSDGEALVSAYWGRYVAFLVGAGGAFSVLRDPSGGLPCHLIEHERVTICFSWLNDALELIPPAHHPRPDPEGVRSHLLFGLHGGRRTALAGVEQILPGEQRCLSDGALPGQLLWNPVSLAKSPSDLEGQVAAELLRAIVRSCARQWASVSNRIVLRLSGGLDSSILASCLSPQDTDAEVLCINYRSTDPGADERHYARSAARAAARPLLELETASGFQLEGLLRILPTPSPGTYVGAMETSSLDARVAAEHNASVLFTGVGGDQLFFESHRWWPAADYLRLRGLDRGLLSVALDAARLGRVSIWHALTMAIRERFNPTGTLISPGRSYRMLTPDANKYTAELDVYRHPALCGDTGLPIGKLHQVQQLMVPMTYYDTLAFESAPEPVYPLLSQPIVELVLRLPTYVLTHGGRSRALARRAFASDLPREVAGRRMKGTTDRSSQRVLKDNLEFVRTLLLEGELVRMGLMDRTRCEQALSTGPSGTNTAGVEIHAMIAVEAWLQSWKRGRASALAPGI